MATPFLSLISVDPSLGKVDKQSLPQQTLMELLIEGFTTNKERISSDLTNDISEWRNVIFNASGDVVRIKWGFLQLGGSVELKWLPCAMIEARFSFNQISGTADLTSLPDGLEILSLARNKFHGTVDLTHLPCGLQRLYLQTNGFSGHTHFSKLPKLLLYLDVEGTQLEGEVFGFSGKVATRFSKVKNMSKNGPKSQV